MPALHPATAYAALAGLPIVMHLAVAAGAPLGRFTVGGRFPGRLPPRWRAAAVVQAAVLAAMAITMLDSGGALRLGLPDMAIWGVVGITVATTVANAASPSRPERLLWTPVTLAMSAMAIALAVS